MDLTTNAKKMYYPTHRKTHGIPILTLFAFGRKMYYLCGTDMRGTSETVLFSWNKACFHKKLSL